MNVSLRYNLVIFIALCLLASCSSTEPEMPSDEYAIKFSIGANTRSSESDYLKLSPFTVFSDIKGPNLETSLNDMTNIQVTYNTETKVWESEKTYYWMPGYEHSFVGVYPASMIASDGSNHEYSDSRLSFSYTFPDNYKEATDILAATHRRKYEKSSPGSTPESPVCLNFGHIMTLVNIAPSLEDDEMGNDDYLIFRKLEFLNFKTQTTFNILPASLQTNSPQTNDFVITSDVAQASPVANITVEFDNPERVYNHRESVNLFDAENAIMVLPQDFDKESEAKIRLTYSINGDASTNVLTLPLAGFKWHTGKSYLYKFFISKWGLKLLRTEIVDWVLKEDDFDATIK